MLMHATEVALLRFAVDTVVLLIATCVCRYDQQIKQLQGVPRDIQALNDQYSLFGSPKYLESPDDRKLAIKQNKVYVETAKVSLSTSTSDSLIDGLLGQLYGTNHPLLWSACTIATLLGQYLGGLISGPMIQCGWEHMCLEHTMCA